MNPYASIQAAVVNHNTSAYTELMLRSLFATHPDLPSQNVRVFDNQSTDDMSGMLAFTAQAGVPVQPSGFSLDTVNNSHGDIMRTFVLDTPRCDYYLFLDADVVLVQKDTIAGLMAALNADPGAFGAGPSMSWDGEQPYTQPDDNPDVYIARLHPCCALVKNTPLFRTVVEQVGLFCVKFLWADREEYLDTFKLMTKVMNTHGLHHIITRQLVIHFFSVSYAWDDERVKTIKENRRDELLAKYRAMQS